MSAPVQSPLLRIPAKSTDEVDLAGSVGHLILHSYGQEPKQFTEQLSVLNRARQDAVRGAGSDTTARDLMYKWFHMLEMLELRFPELRAPFPWKDAFTHKPITQHSLAYEKASVIFNIAAVLSSIGARTHRIGSAPSASAVVAASAGIESPTSPTPAPASVAPTPAAASGTKLAYTSLRQAAGMLSYINDNFLHAPSTDMSKDVVRWLVDVELAQATEVFWERTLEEKKGGNLVTRIASQAAVMYASLAEESKEWVNRSVFERSWSLLVQTKAKYFASVAQYYRALLDEAASAHGSCLVRLTLSETLAKEAQKLCITFSTSAGSSSSSSSTTSSLPPDAATSLRIILENHLGIVSARKTQAVKDNDLIYHDILPTESTLPAIEPMIVAQPITIQDIYASPEVQKVTGATATGTPANDLFSALVPLGVHEAASMYSEEKAKLVRSEGERVDMANAQLEASLESMSLPRGLKKFKPDGVQDLLDPGSEVVEWAEEEIQGGGSRGEDGLGTGPDAIDDGLRRVNTSREQARRDFDEAGRMLDEEAAQCEKLRVRHGDKWTQAPSGLQAKALRSDLKSNRTALQQAAENDEAIEQLWKQSAPLIRVLLGGREALETAFAEALSGQGSGRGNDQLVDLLQDDSGSDAQRESLLSAVSNIESNLSMLHRLKKERSDALTELRSRIQADDISHILILNRRASSDAQTQLFQQELEKFRPLTQRIARTLTEQEKVVADITHVWKDINEASFGRTRAQEWEKKNQAREKLIASLRRAKDSNAQVRAGLAKGLTFYTQLQEIASSIRRNARSFVEERSIERDRLTNEISVQDSSRSASFASSPPPHPSSHSYEAPSLESAFGRMGMQDAQRHGGATAGRSSMSPPPQAPPPQRYAQQTSSPYDSMDAAFGGSGSYTNSGAPPLPPSSSHAHYASPPPPAAPAHYGAPSPAGYDHQNAPTSGFSGGYGQTQSYGSGGAFAPSSANPPVAQRQPSLPPPPPQWQSSYGAPSAQAGHGGPPPAPLPSSGSHLGGYAAPPPPQPQHGYGQTMHTSAASSPYSSLPSPPAAQTYRGPVSGGPPPPPLPYQQQGFGQAPPTARNTYGAPPPPTQSYSSSYHSYNQQNPPPPPPPQQQQRWQPPY